MPRWTRSWGRGCGYRCLQRKGLHKLDSGTWIRWIRIGTLLSIVCLVAIAAVQISSAGLKAPLLTIMGSAAIIIALFSVSRRAITIQNVGTNLGTVVVMAGGGYWLVDARAHSSSHDLELSSFLTNILILLLFVYVISMLIPTVYNLAMRIRSR